MLSEDGADELSGDFEGETTLVDLVVIGNAIRKMAHPQLKKLRLNFKKCKQLSDISALGGAIAALSSLQHLQIDFGYCSKLSDISALGGAIAALSSLQHLQINFQSCSQLSDISALGGAIAALNSLQHLQINFEYCAGLAENLRVEFNQVAAFLEVCSYCFMIFAENLPCSLAGSGLRCD
jgi:hypothetical protein